MIKARPRCSTLLGLVVLTGLGCKRPNLPVQAPIWDEEPGPGKVEALGTLSPPWETPLRIVFDSGLVTFWLHEPDTPAFHLRVLFPIDPALGSDDVPAVHVAVEALRGSLAHSLGPVHALVAVEPGPGRLELAIHGRNEDAARILDRLGRVMAHPPDAAQFKTAARRLAEQVPANPSAEALAVATLTARLLGRDPRSLYLDRPRLAALGANRVSRAWKVITDPSRAVLVAHAGTSATASRPSLNALVQQWSAPRMTSKTPALARLRPAEVRARGEGRLLAEPKAVLEPIAGENRGESVVAFGRLVPTPDVASRSRARLAQRILQESMDARLTILGDFAVFVVVVELHEGSADAALERAVRSVSAWSSERQPVQRLFQAAQLWLGARVVEASVAGEDWTALWTQALDLASDEDDVALALAHDADTMLKSDPEALTKWQSQWLDPIAGREGWAWVVAGANKTQLRALRSITPLEAAP